MLLFLNITLGPGHGGSVHISQLPGPVLPATFFMAWRGRLGSGGRVSWDPASCLWSPPFPSRHRIKWCVFSVGREKLFLVCTCQTQAQCWGPDICIEKATKMMIPVYVGGWLLCLVPLIALLKLWADKAFCLFSRDTEYQRHASEPQVT